jgi:cytochrome P450
MTTQQSHNEDTQLVEGNAGRRRVIQISGQAMSLDPFPWYEQMRGTQPVFYDQENKLWHVFLYDDVRTILNDPATFSSEVRQRTRSEEELKQIGSPSILGMDPPRHRQLRTLVTQAFTPRTVANLAPRITELVNEYLDKVSDSGQMDVIEDLAYPLPVTVIAELLGVPTADQALFKHWSDTIVSPERAGDETIGVVKEMNRYLKAITDERRQQPQDDLISALIAAQVDGEHLSEDDLLDFYRLLLVAGNETTTNLIGNAMICFDQYPESIEQMRDDPSLIPGALEEVLRFRSPIQRMIRVATKDTELHGQHIKAGDLISPWLGSANRDETQFPNPNTFDIHRSPNRHVAFGHGIHFCVGAPLSRIESKIAYEVILQRFKDIKRDRSVELQRITAGSAFFGVQKLPITFSSAR